MDKDDEYLTPKEAAMLLRNHPYTLERYRRLGGGPPFSKPFANGRVLYKRSDLILWVDSKKVNSTNQLP
ncbi:helix-turn-helix domain-containing protein [Paramagnetospirillum kuznetsovii]|uniref:helix-turn-helix domain-containing protein n=1 Tax=Paramagnetospirillum kuznetsovii TaxID=2053833 RepID=UPI000DD31B4F